MGVGEGLHEALGDLATGIALVLVFEGILWALFPERMRLMAVRMAVIDGSQLRMAGLVAAAFGVALVWLVRRVF